MATLVPAQTLLNSFNKLEYVDEAPLLSSAKASVTDFGYRSPGASWVNICNTFFCV